MSKMHRFGIGLAGLLAVFILGCATSQQELAAQAKITKDEATKIALNRVPGGTVKECEIENENGKLVWSFDLATQGTQDITEVQVDALTGAIVSVEKETPADQKKEKEADHK